MAIQNRYEFIYYLACTNANPNGDPDMGNTPRIAPETSNGSSRMYKGSQDFAGYRQKKDGTDLLKL